jgi:superfamily II DNA or RNA helicase
MKTRDDVRHAALEAIGENLRLAGVDSAMRTGKTAIGVEHMASQFTNHSKFLVVYPSKSIKDSWLDELKRMDLEYLLDHITFTTYISLKKQQHDYDYIYLDECHSLKKNHNSWLYNYVTKGGCVLGLTGTYPTSKYSEKGKMCNFYCPRIFQYSVDDAVEDGVLNNYTIYIHELNLNKVPTIIRNGAHGEFKVSEVNQYTFWNNQLLSLEEDSEIEPSPIALKLGYEGLTIRLMKELQSYETKVKYAKFLLSKKTDKTIVFANTKEQADWLCANSYYSGNKYSEDNLNLFKESTIEELSCIEQLSQGITIPGLKSCIILHSYANNKNAAQKLSRCLGLNPDDEATIHILCYSDTVDKRWVTNALKSFNQDNIHWIPQQYYEGLHY